MHKKTIFLLSILSVYQIHAMNQPMEIEKPDLSINRKAYLQGLLTHTIALPGDLKKYVFNFLFHNLEFHDEFIARVKNTIKKPLPIHYYHDNFTKPEHSTPIFRQFIQTG